MDEPTIKPVMKELMMFGIIGYMRTSRNVSFHIGFGICKDTVEANSMALAIANEKFPINGDDNYFKHQIIIDTLPHIFMIDVLNSWGKLPSSTLSDNPKELVALGIAGYIRGIRDVEQCMDYGVFTSLDDADIAADAKANEVYPINKLGYYKHLLVTEIVPHDLMLEFLNGLGEIPDLSPPSNE